MSKLVLALVGCCLLSAASVRGESAPPAEDETVSFSRHVLPALTKLGCNAGKCHGSFQGRGGLQLSLFGFDPAFDYEALVVKARGRRAFPAAPAQSLMLRKPSGRLPHGGGVVLDPASESYRLLHAWIKQGAPSPSPNDPEVVRVTVAPADLRLAVNETRPLRLVAEWSDGQTSDAAPWAIYEVKHEGAAEVSPAGVVTAKRPGQTSITARFMGQVATVNLTVPVREMDDDFYAQLSRHNFIDEHVIAGWKKIGIEPAPLADDAEFVRRVFLDLIGTLPTPDEVRSFLADNADDKRRRLIDDLLERPEYVAYWSLKWGDLLRVHRRYVGDKGLENFSGWVRQNLRENRPLDTVVRELLTARGNLYTNGPVAFYFTDSSPENFAETAAQVFLGVRIHCARCHHHPYEVWSQDDYYGLAAFFTRFEVKDNGDGGRFGGAKMIRVTSAPNREMRPKKVVEPGLLGDDDFKLNDDSPSDIRGKLAEWITGRDNPYFARNFANRYWAYLMGRGLVEPVDDLRDTNPATHPDLLEALATDFAKSGYDVKHLLRFICNSRAYQLASELAPERDVDGRLYSHRRPRRLPAEVLLDAINDAAGVEESFEGLPAGTRAIELPDPSVRSYFLDTFGRPMRNDPCECARQAEPDLRQALHLANSIDLHKKIAASGGRVAMRLNEKSPPEELVEELYLATYSRPPAADEIQTALELAALAPSPQEGYEDLLWALINSSPFLFQH